MGQFTKVLPALLFLFILYYYPNINFYFSDNPIFAGASYFIAVVASGSLLAFAKIQHNTKD